jgi:hypothetical protein
LNPITSPSRQPTYDSACILSQHTAS